MLQKKMEQKLCEEKLRKNLKEKEEAFKVAKEELQIYLRRKNRDNYLGEFSNPLYKIKWEGFEDGYDGMEDENGNDNPHHPVHLFVKYANVDNFIFEHGWFLSKHDYYTTFISGKWLGDYKCKYEYDIDGNDGFVMLPEYEGKSVSYFKDFMTPPTDKDLIQAHNTYMKDFKIEPFIKLMTDYVIIDMWENYGPMELEGEWLVNMGEVSKYGY